MKPSHYLLLFALLLSSCAAPTEPVRTATAVPTPTATPTATLTPTPASPDGDYLIYIVKKHLMFYDPATNTHTPLLPAWEIEDFSLSAQHLAFSSFHDGNRDIFLLDYPFTRQAPLNITRGTFIAARPLSWSPDGHYLAYASTRVDGNALVIWDKTTSAPVYQYREAVTELAWSPDGRLAFSALDTFVPPSGNSVEILLWDGSQTINVSQNPSGEDLDPVWIADGRLAFLSARGEEYYDIFTWDGVAARKFVNFVPGLTSMYFFESAVWTSSGVLTFMAFDPENRFAQIYAWDGKTVTNLSQNLDAHAHGQRWRSDGYWAFATFFSTPQVIYVRDAKSQTQFVTRGQYDPAWSQAGRLVFCVPRPSEKATWGLSMWDGAQVVEIMQEYEIRASWSNGAGVVCSSG